MPLYRLRWTAEASWIRQIRCHLVQSLWETLFDASSGELDAQRDHCLHGWQALHQLYPYGMQADLRWGRRDVGEHAVHQLPTHLRRSSTAHHRLPAEFWFDEEAGPKLVTGAAGDF